MTVGDLWKKEEIHGFWTVKMNGNYIIKNKGRQHFPSSLLWAMLSGNCLESSLHTGSAEEFTAAALPGPASEQESEVLDSGEFGLPWDMPKKI